jgi:ParB-like chromosome segregation protein Spo0J
MSVRNRIVRHVRVRASDLVPHEMNPRRHGEEQRQALKALYDEIGFARSLLAYELPDGRLKLIDGHLRAELSPDLELDVEVLDVNDAEARALLLSIDPLAQLASYDATVLEELRQITSTDSDVLRDLWQAIAASAEAVEETLRQARGEETVPEQFLILVRCENETRQSELLTRFQDEGLSCKALLS